MTTRRCKVFKDILAISRCVNDRQGSNYFAQGRVKMSTFFRYYNKQHAQASRSIISQASRHVSPYEFTKRNKKQISTLSGELEDVINAIEELKDTQIDAF